MAWLRSDLITAFFLLLTAFGGTAAASSRVFCAAHYFVGDLERRGAAIAFKWYCKGLNPLTFRYFLCPISIENKHWVLGVVDREQRTVAVWDSYCIRRHKYESLLLGFANEQLGGGFAVAAQPHGLPEQRDAFSCGVYVCAFAYILCHGRVPASADVSDANQVYWRQLIGFCCLNKKIF